MVKRIKASFLAVGDKGYNAIKDSAKDVEPGTIITYNSSQSSFQAEDFSILARRFGFDFQVSKFPNLNKINSDLFFAVGWQFMIAEPPANLVVLHDSMLPKYRGFAPTVTALLCGDSEIGVTALLPGVEADTGDILSQASVKIPHPLKISDAFEMLRPCYRSVIATVCNDFMERGSLSGYQQDDVEASYSLWRDIYDYAIDWNQDAQDISRFIDAVGEPYFGALTASYERVIYKIRSGAPIKGPTIANVNPGKVLSRDATGIGVVCGNGILLVTDIVPIGQRDSVPIGLRIRFADVTSTRQAIGDQLVERRV